MSDKIDDVLDGYEIGNDEAFLLEMIDLHIDRMDLFVIMGFVELALRHPKVSENLKRLGRGIGGQILFRLLGDGLRLPDEVKEAFFKTFEMEG
ncbi:hypothetical protein ES702_05048 [subsurface metagenome]